MGRSGKIVTGLVGLALLIGALLVTHNKSNNQATNNTAATPSETTAQTEKPTNAAATLTYTDSGFSPSSITVKSGDTVAITNNSSGPIEFDSDPHPVHTSDPELNIGTVDAGKTVTFKVSAKGTHGVHNHLDSSKTATVIVQ
jgi:plastocyanin